MSRGFLSGKPGTSNVGNIGLLSQELGGGRGGVYSAVANFRADREGKT